MRLTLSVIKADIGSIGGHIAPSQRLLETVRTHVQAHGEGMHHVGYLAPSIDHAKTMLRELTADGTEVLLSAWIDGVYFYYLDAHPMIYEVWAGDLDSLAPARRIGAPGE